MSAALVASGLSRRYDSSSGPIEALRPTSFELAAGSSLAVVGPSGSGKTSLVHLCALLDAPTAGSLTIGGANCGVLPERERRALRSTAVGVVFQQFHLVPYLSAFENVMLALRFTATSADERRDRVRRVLDTVGLSHRHRHRPGELSGGQQQRVAIARAIVKRPALIVADEPTGNLDRSTTGAVLDLLQTICTEGTALLVATHDAEVAEWASGVLDLGAA